jgi:hypothetical protein
MLNELPESVRSRLLKIQALAERGVGGEAEAAKRMLEDLCEEHGISVEDLTSLEVKFFAFTAKSPYHKKLLQQVCFHVLQAKSITVVEDSSKPTVHVKMTALEHLDVESCYAFYRAAWNGALEEFFLAFVHKHNIFGPPRDEPPSPIDQERLLRLMKAMQGIGGPSWTKPRARLEG